MNGKDKLFLGVRNLTIGYKHFSIKNIDFVLKHGDIMGLVGRSGSGKSTLIKSLIGMIKPKTGSIEFYINNKKTDLHKYIGYSPQQNALYNFLTIKENIHIFGKLRGLKKHEIIENSQHLLDLLDLENSVNKKIIQLSGGMKKRTDLLITFLHDPLFIILDEPFTGLDISLQRFIWNFITKQARRGKIILITSHLLEDIQTYCNKIGLIEKNRFYGTDQIKRALKKSGETNLERFLEKLFIEDIKEEK